MTRLFTGTIYLNGEFTNAVLFDESGVQAIGEAALETGIQALSVPFLTHGFRDAHVHPVLAGRELLGPRISAAKSIAEVQSELRKWLDVNPRTEWLIGGSYDRSMAPDGRMLAIWLDEVSSTTPIVLHSNDHHALWLNSAALEIAGLRNAAPKLTLGSIDIDESGKPTGVLREEEAKALVEQHYPTFDLELDLRALERAQTVLLTQGVTSAFDAWVTPEIHSVYQLAIEREALKIPTDLAFWLQPKSWQDDLAKASSLGFRHVKLFIDGVLGSSTALLEEPYLEQNENRGDEVWSAEQLHALLQECERRALNPHAHAIGDAAIAMIMDAVEASKFASRLTIAHVELLSDRDLDRATTMNVIFNMQPLWARKDPMHLSCRKQLGENRADALYRTRDILDSGIKIEFGSDWPVSSSAPLEGLYTAVNRCLPGNPATTLGANQRITTAEALSAYADSTPAANFVVLSANPFEADLDTIEVLETIIGGRTEFTRQ